MKKPKNHSAFLIAFIALVSFVSFAHAQVSDSSPSSELNDQQLTQNIKDRIKKIATQSSTLTQKRKIAFIGSIEKIANETITIKTDDAINLASVSATTSYARMPSGSESQLKDVSIGDFAVAMGYINGSQVLETKRILLYDKAPQSPKMTSIAGLVKLIDEDEQAITLSTDGEDVTITLTKNTLMSMQKGIEKSDIDLIDLQVGQYIAIIYLPSPDEYTTSKAISILATSIIKDLPVDALGSPSAQLNATPAGKPTIPPELR